MLESEHRENVVPDVSRQQEILLHVVVPILSQALAEPSIPQQVRDLVRGSFNRVNEKSRDSINHDEVHSIMEGAHNAKIREPVKRHKLHLRKMFFKRMIGRQEPAAPPVDLVGPPSTGQQQCTQASNRAPEACDLSSSSCGSAMAGEAGGPPAIRGYSPRIAGGFMRMASSFGEPGGSQH
jgi:hypothetical protein